MEPRIGVYICHCGTNIAGKVNVEEVAEFAGKLPYVVVSKAYKFMCSDPGQNLIVEDIKQHKLNRVVVAACSPTMHEPTFRRTCQEGGLNQYLFQMANIREHCSWVTEDEASATEKAKSIIAGAVYKATYLEPLEVKKVKINPNTLVVGGGITGIQATLEIADSGHKVYLVEKEPSIGGHMAQFDKTFPTLDCAACILTPKMVQVAQHQNIKLFTYSEVLEVSGFVGNFKVKILKKARYIDPDKCNGCGECALKCPIKVLSEFDEELGMRRAIYKPFAQGVPNLFTIDKEHCTKILKDKCGLCEKICPRGAIDYEQKDEIIEVSVGVIILATGFQIFDARQMPQYGYGRLDNVMTSLEFERLCSANGPTGGKIVLKDGTEPKSVGILHCIGSRDDRFHPYCSRVCCMYALKYSHLIKEKTGAEVYQFYVDMRCFGKGYEEFYNRLLEEGVRFVRGKAAEVTDFAVYKGEEGKLIVRCEDTAIGAIRRIPLDMVILANALEARDDAKELARIFSINTGADGFFIEKHPKLAPVSTTTDGVFIAGCCQGCKDIPDAVAQGAAAASEALSLIDRGEVEIEPYTSIINADLCSGCKTCVELCPYTAIEFDEEKNVSVVNDALCKGCGTCVAACPSGAATAQHFTDKQIFSEIEGVLA